MRYSFEASINTFAIKSLQIPNHDECLACEIPNLSREFFLWVLLVISVVPWILGARLYGNFSASSWVGMLYEAEE